MNLESGAFGDPSATETLILFWTKMEELHYPGAGSTKKFLEERLERERQAQQAAAATPQTGRQVPPELAQAVEEKARQDAMAAAGAGAGS